MIVAGSNEPLLNFNVIVILKVISHSEIKGRYDITLVYIYMNYFCIMLDVLLGLEKTETELPVVKEK
jgi:hypothetical protein